MTNSQSVMAAQHVATGCGLSPASSWSGDGSKGNGASAIERIPARLPVSSCQAPIDHARNPQRSDQIKSNPIGRPTLLPEGQRHFPRRRAGRGRDTSRDQAIVSFDHNRTFTHAHNTLTATHAPQTIIADNLLSIKQTKHKYGYIMWNINASSPQVDPVHLFPDEWARPSGKLSGRQAPEGRGRRGNEESSESHPAWL